MRDVIERITTYLINGGVFNPELADHRAVRDLLIDVRAELAAERERMAALRECYDGFLKATGFKTRGGIENVLSERDALRAKLDAERDNNKSLNKHLTRAQGNTQKMKAERDAMRALLQEAREYTGYAAFYGAGDRIEADHAVDLCARIDATLNKGGGDEPEDK